MIITCHWTAFLTRGCVWFLFLILLLFLSVLLFFFRYDFGDKDEQSDSAGGVLGGAKAADAKKARRRCTRCSPCALLWGFGRPSREANSPHPPFSRLDIASPIDLLCPSPVLLLK